MRGAAVVDRYTEQRCESHGSDDAACLVELFEFLVESGADGAERSSVTAAQLRALYVLDRHDRISLRGLGDELGAVPSSVSRMCDRMEALGILERLPSRRSRREVEVRLTSRGRAVLGDQRARRESKLRISLASMDARARHVLAIGLERFIEHVDGAARRNVTGFERSA